jgi:hypothetical protein
MGLQPVTENYRDQPGKPLSASPTAADEADGVDGLRYITDNSEIPQWAKEIGQPVGWLLGRYSGFNTQRPWRISVCGPQQDGGWDACETVTVYGFSGTIPTSLLQRRADKALATQGTFEIQSSVVMSDQRTGASAVRCSGYMTAGGLLIRTKQNHFAVPSATPGEGRLVERCWFVEAKARPRFEATIDEFDHQSMNAFVAATTSL